LLRGPEKSSSAGDGGLKVGDVLVEDGLAGGAPRKRAALSAVASRTSNQCGQTSTPSRAQSSA
jgi:hypothetical protein